MNQIGFRCEPSKKSKNLTLTLVRVLLGPLFCIFTIMKNLLILLFIPLLGVSQVSYNDVMSINSEKMFKKVMIENGYELESETDGKTIYGFDIVRDSIDGSKSTKWSYYYDDGEFVLSFSRNSSLSELFNLKEDRGENEYDFIVEEIKKNCKYYDIIESKNDDGVSDFVCYSCSESKYKGKIGFMVSKGWGYIRHFILD